MDFVVSKSLHLPIPPNNYRETGKESDFRTNNLGAFPGSFRYFSRVYRQRCF